MIEPNSPEWYEARCGRLGASRVYDATARQKSGKHYAARAELLIELATERLTGQCAQHYVSLAMQWGIDYEPQARAAIEYLRGVEVAPVGWVQHATLANAGATPDGAVGDELIEIKCPTSATHVETLLDGEIDARYVAQIDWQLACCPWANAAVFASFDPRLPPELRLWCKLVERDEQRIAALTAEVATFPDELDAIVLRLRSRAA